MYSLKVHFVSGSVSPIMQFPTMHPAEFCRKWVPVFRDYREGEYGFGVECAAVISSVTGYKRASVYKWLRGDQEPPLSVRMALGIMDLLLETDDGTLSTFRRQLRESLYPDTDESARDS